MNSCQRYFSACVLALLTQAAFAQSAPPGGFAVLANTAATCTDGTIDGSVGTFAAPPTGSVTLTTCPITGTQHVGDAAAIAAYEAFLAQYTALAPKVGDNCPVITGTLAGASLAPGVHCVSAEAKTGLLTLDGDANDTWTIKVPSGALTGTGFSVVMAGGAQACNVTWWVDAAVTMTDSNLKGTLLAGAGSTLTRGTLVGNDFARADATITGTALVGCEAQAGPGPGPGPKPGTCSDRVTGGGFIKVGNGKHGKANFGVTAGMSPKGKLRGHLTYIDHSTGMKVKGTGVTAYVVVDRNTRHIEGTATVDGVKVTYVVDATDNGEGKKKSKDSFAITLSNGYSASGGLAGGNIQLHERHCDKGHKGHHGHDHDDDHDDDDDDDDDRDGKDRGKTHKPYGTDGKKHK